MKNEFAPYDIALGAKEIGFDEPTICSYYKGGQGLYMGNPTHLDDVQAPLYQQLFRWFREDYGWTIKINQILKDEWSFTLENFNLEKDLFGGRFNSYEEAELECLRKLIEIVKEK